MTATVTLMEAARRTGLAHNGAAMARVCSGGGVDVAVGRVNLSAFDGGTAELAVTSAQIVATGTF